uniref:Uncharacterized protein n=1 Tax=Candidatus Kentrum sp. UNK TaxID=2126344 RepID=A0A451AME0_9GAMM|nr:MAG: hypothetical protein BECKUNK1418G_GA0071005_11305 [Candidatus Kentron sp. UNK]VFK72701.1 MAG: hypothetical protein BECKUNK1418H_GA0071006_11323 [Candidatus Kentron sp. UNK]
MLLGSNGGRAVASPALIILPGSVGIEPGIGGALSPYRIARFDPRGRERCLGKMPCKTVSNNHHDG